MKKILSVALLCVSLATIAMVSTNASTHRTFPTTISCADDDRGPSVALHVLAQSFDGGYSTIYIDIYRAKNVCDSYVAYREGTTTNPMAVLKNPDYSKGGRSSYGYPYYVSAGRKYYFNL